MSDSAYIVGIDLGTTNSAVAFVDNRHPDEHEPPPLEVFQIPQVVHAGQVARRHILPSFLYLPGPHELPPGSVALPWDTDRPYVVGEFARGHGSKLPQHLVASAKSWLCHDGVDRRSAILPWAASEDTPRLSPIEVSGRYLSHLREAWNQERDEPLEDQDIILGVPASFDAVARELTMEAAHAAGLKHVTLLEEPQAAFYSWLEANQKTWRKQVSPGDIVLVVDIGGGTTDFSLIAVRDEGGDMVLDRIAVGEHILLGGDNMDLALAVAIANRMRQEGTRLDGWQMQVLAGGCRTAKERMLSDGSIESEQIVVPGRGSSLIGGSLETELQRFEVELVLLDGFFPHNAVSEHARRARRVGLQELGLPYESDAAITRHLAAFLTAHLGSMERLGVPLKKKQTFVHPTALLFNGGVLTTPLLRARVADIVTEWLETEKAPPVRVLEAPHLDLAVARGGAQYGLVRRGRGIRIRGGTARTYYIGLQTSMPAVPGMPPPLKALCVVPYGMEEGTKADIPARDFGLVVGEPAEFPFLESPVRRKDAVGTIVEDWDEDIHQSTTLETVLQAEGRTGNRVPVRLQSHVTEVGTLELWCVEKDGPGKWKLEFNVREKEPAV